MPNLSTPWKSWKPAGLKVDALLSTFRQATQCCERLMSMIWPCCRPRHHVCHLLTVHPSGIFRTRNAFDSTKAATKCLQFQYRTTGKPHEAKERCMSQPVAHPQKNGVQVLTETSHSQRTRSNPCKTLLQSECVRRKFDESSLFSAIFAALRRLGKFTLATLFNATRMPRGSPTTEYYLT